MKRYRVEVTRIDEYIIEIDEKIIDEKWFEEFRKFFWDAEMHKDLAGDLAEMQALDGSYQGLMEGYGHITRDGELPYHYSDFDENGNWKPENERRKPEPGFNIIIVDEGNQLEKDITELNP